MIIDITSANNANIKHIKALSSRKERRKYKEYTVEGIKSVNEAMKSGKEIVSLVISDDFDEALINSDFEKIYRVPGFVFEKICDTETPQGILAVLKQDENEISELEEGGLYLYCDGISDPGNMGTLIRTAEAAGFSGVLCSKNCVELYNPKTVRASMGSFFRMSVYEVDFLRLSEFKNNGASLFGGALCDDTKDYREVEYNNTIVIIVGNEANGISDEVLSVCTPVKIPIYGGAESLNAAVAAGILMYEAANRRKMNKI